MAIFIDIGNTNLKIYNVEKNKVISRELLAWSNFEPSSFLNVLHGVKKIVLTSVVQEKETIIVDLLKSQKIDVKVANKDLKPSLKFKVEDSKTIGSDRIVNAVAAYEKAGGACIVIDLGTALTIDAISSKGEFLGGVICPGLRTAAKALEINAPALSGHQLIGEVSLPGKNTGEAIRTGLVYLVAGGIDKVVTELTAQLGGEAKVFGTGGDFDRVKEYLSCKFQEEPDLLAYGMMAMAKK